MSVLFMVTPQPPMNSGRIFSGFSSLFDAYAEFGASMEICSGGQLSWYIGVEGGEGTCFVDGSLLTAELSRTADNNPMMTEFDILHDGDEVYLGMHWNNGIVFWSWGDDDSDNLSGDTGQVAETCVDRDLSSDSMVIGTSAIIDTEIDGAVGMNSGIFNNPFMIWGKYRKKLFRYYLPVSFQFHHTQMDGAHAGRFLENLQKEINNLRSI